MSWVSSTPRTLQPLQHSDPVRAYKHTFAACMLEAGFLPVIWESQSDGSWSVKSAVPVDPERFAVWVEMLLKAEALANLAVPDEARLIQLLKET